MAFTWNYYLKHPEFITILGTENLLQGAHARKSSNLRALSGTAVGMLEPIVKAGQQQGLFREDIDIRHVYLMIASLCYFYNSNLHTLSCFLDDALASPRRSSTGWNSSATWCCAGWREQARAPRVCTKSFRAKVRRGKNR